MKFSYLYFTVHYCWHLESRLISLCSSVLCSGVHCCCCWVEGSSVFYFVHHSHKAHPAPLLHSSLCSLKLKYSVKQFSLNQLYVLCLDWEFFLLGCLLFLSLDPTGFPLLTSLGSGLHIFFLYSFLVKWSVRTQSTLNLSQFVMWGNRPCWKTLSAFTLAQSIMEI